MDSRSDRGHNPYSVVTGSSRGGKVTHMVTLVVTRQVTWLLLFIVGPLIAIGVGVYGWKEYEAYQERIAAGLILPEQIAITDLNLQRSSEELFPSLYLTGTIQNRSSYVLREIILDVTPQYRLLGTTTERIAVHVLPGNSTSFREELPFYPERLLPEKQRIPVDFKVMGARGQLADKR